MKRAVALLAVVMALAFSAVHAQTVTPDPAAVVKATNASFVLEQEVLVKFYFGDATEPVFERRASVSETATVFRRCGSGACLITTAHGVDLTWMGAKSLIKETRDELSRLGLNGTLDQVLEAMTERVPLPMQAMVRTEIITLNKFWLYRYVDDNLKIPAFVYTVEFNDQNKWNMVTPHITGADIAILWAPLANVEPMPIANSLLGVKTADGVWTMGAPAAIGRQYATGWISDAYPRDYGQIGWSHLIATRMPSIGGASGSPVYSEKTGEIIGIIKGGIDDITLLVPAGTIQDFLKSLPPE